MEKLYIHTTYSLRSKLLIVVDTYSGFTCTVPLHLGQNLTIGLTIAKFKLNIVQFISLDLYSKEVSTDIISVTIT